MLPLAVPGFVLAFGYLAMTKRENSLAPESDNRSMIILVIGIRCADSPMSLRSAAAGSSRRASRWRRGAEISDAPR